MTNSEQIFDTILGLERRVWAALVAGDAAVDAELLEDGFLGLYTTGFADKAEHVGQLANGPTVLRYALSGSRVLELAPGVVLHAYRAEFTRVGQSTPEAMYVASVWRRGAQGWRNIFSQDTPEGGLAPV
ncbi:hypothetical protein U879_12585 [Defluviimonas sp. 20V17]|uniref:DUF4440 domain-containing protein n=1 Tax=Allgaiera indica TaxID=765699 RepID=A0AAN4ZYM1_9RHOB|nr:nuclear transport factor 2 family protein [Allgaiera indica]KDB03348.1 hypothetical protein U879_12585 [Defluviimonas sp. 20V17]GHE00474.1 hypothetical protein GCM10008024_12120 [Allgaiera indica]SDW61399.1 hypothetical protein SAMN05444006_105104 [Allgaiera indica]